MAGLFVIIIILGCAAFQYLKGTFIKALAATIIAICATIVAFAYFEVLARFLTGYSASLATWAQPLCFLLLFVLSFAVLQTIAAQLTRKPVDLGFLPERIGRICCGILLGWLISGVVLTAAAMSPLPNKYPYERFDLRNPDAERPKKVLLNADGFATGWFSMISSGSLSGKKSFATLHPDLLSQLFLNRHSKSKNIPIMTSSEAVEVPTKNGAWYASENMIDTDGKPLSPKTGHNLIIVRVGIKKRALKDAGKFTLSQLRLICKPKGSEENPLAGKGRNVYPTGYIKAPGVLQQKRLSDVIQIQSDQSEDRVKWIDFAFYIPSGLIPVLVEFKLNNVVGVSALVSADQAPAPVFFSEPSTDQDRTTEPPQPPEPVEPAESSAPSEGGRGLSDFSRSIVGEQLDEGE